MEIVTIVLFFRFFFLFVQAFSIFVLCYVKLAWIHIDMA